MESGQTDKKKRSALQRMSKTSKGKKRIKTSEIFNLGNLSSEEEEEAQSNQYDPEKPFMQISSLPSASKDNDTVQDFFLDEDFPPMSEYGHQSLLNQRISLKSKEILSLYLGEKKCVKTSCVIKPSLSEDYFLFVKPTEEKFSSILGIEEGAVKNPNTFSKRIYLDVNNTTSSTHFIPADCTIAYLCVQPWKY